MGYRTRIGLAAVAVYCLGGLGAVAAWETTVGGHRFELTGRLEDRQVFRTDEDTPNELNLQQLWLGTKYDLTDVVRFESVVSLLNGGPTTKSTGAGIYDFSEVFQSLSPAFNVEEAYLEVSQPEFDLRLGFQKFAWGKLDRVQPTDVLNPRKYRDPFLPSEEENKRGVPAAAFDYYVPTSDWVPEEARLSFIWVPQYMPFEFPLPGERWFPPAAVPPSELPLTASRRPLPCDNGADIPGVIPIGFEVRNVAPPEFQLENSGYGFRASGFSAGVDYAFYYYHGLDAQPAFLLSATASSQIGTPPTLDVRANTVLTPVYKSIDLWGADGAYSFGGFTFRAEGAFISGRPFARDVRTLIPNAVALERLNPGLFDRVCNLGANIPVKLPASFVVRDALEWGTGVDYDLEGYFLLLQLNQTDVFDNDVRLLIPDVDTRLLANIRKRFFHEDLQLQFIATYAFESSYSILLPRVTYRIWEGLEAQAGYLNIAGSENSLIGQYKHNDEAYVLLRYLF